VAAQKQNEVTLTPRHVTREYAKEQSCDQQRHPRRPVDSGKSHQGELDENHSSSDFTQDGEAREHIDQEQGGATGECCDQPWQQRIAMQAEDVTAKKSSAAQYMQCPKGHERSAAAGKVSRLLRKKGQKYPSPVLGCTHRHEA